MAAPFKTVTIELLARYLCGDSMTKREKRLCMMNLTGILLLTERQKKKAKKLVDMVS